jgi:redox-sensitive bicupin YhaK (pirin superfamily)
LQTRLINVVSTLEGEGFEVKRPFPVQGLSHVDPFLLIDQIGPKQMPANQRIGTDWHPHRGFETVSYNIRGDSDHLDTEGNEGHMEPGDVQWMTAGSGIIHKEGPKKVNTTKESEIKDVFGIQLWVNLPAAHKMDPPKYQDMRADEIPSKDFDGVKIKVIAGNAFGISSHTNTFTPIVYAHISKQSDTKDTDNKFETEIDPSHNVIIFPLVGKISGKAFNKKTGEEKEFEVVEGKALVGSEIDFIEFNEPLSSSDGTDVLLLTGQPINEPVVRYGPFVMNDVREIQQAFEDFRSGKMGEIPN